MEDYIVRGTAANKNVRLFAAKTTGIVQEARDIHQLSPVATAALGRLLTASAIMGNMLKGEKDSLTIIIKGDGPMGGLVVASDILSNVRGYVYNPSVDLPLKDDNKLDVGGAIGKGTLTVIKDLGLKEPYSSQIELINGEIAVDLTYYFASSEQTPTAVGLGVLINPDGTVEHAGGYVIQLLPDANEDIISYIENTLDSMPPVSKLMSFGETPESILDLFFAEKGLEILEKYPCQYQCSCSRQRMERGIRSLGLKELQEIEADGKGAECVCHFCNSKYQFDHQFIQEIIKDIKS